MTVAPVIDLDQLCCFVTAAEELHFGRAAQRLGILPASFGRRIRLLEESVGSRLFARTTRNVVLTADGAAFLADAKRLLADADALVARTRARARARGTELRIGAIDTAAAGLLPQLLRDLRERRPEIAVELVEDKTIRLLPRLLSGRLDLAFVRPPEFPDRALEFLFLFHETPVVAVRTHDRLASRSRLALADLADQPLIVPERKSRPHSHDVTIKLFAEAGLSPNIVQHATEKQTIVGMVAAGLGAAIVPRWTARIAAKGVRFVPIRRPRTARQLDTLPLAAAWIRGLRDPARDAVLAIVRERLAVYAKGS